MSRLEKDIEFTYGNRINWYMLFYACVIDKLVEKGKITMEEANDLTKSVDNIATRKFGIFIYDKDVNPEEYAKSNVSSLDRINLSRI